MYNPIYLFFIIYFFVSSPLLAKSHIWLIGGGPELYESQAQIEQNVLWIQKVIQNIVKQPNIYIFFTDGEHPEADVMEWKALAESQETLQPLARIFGYDFYNGLTFRNHTLSGNIESAELKSIDSTLAQQLQQLQPEDEALFVFNGHGHQDLIFLWNYDEINTAYLSQLLKNNLKHEITARFIFTQCYSGSFFKLTMEGNRCGFFSTAENDTAEGCSLSLNQNDYRDYSTYFFAALYGKNRTETPLLFNPDQNKDGQISFLEAHHYALIVAKSSDIPRSSSEIFIQKNTHWYQKFIPTETIDNPYQKLAQEVKNFHQIIQSKQDLIQSKKQIYMEKENLSDDLWALKNEIKDILYQRWPTLGYPYTKNFYNFLIQDLEEAQQFILDHPNYPIILKKAEEYRLKKEKLLEINRDITQLEKIEYLEKLAKSYATFKTLNNPALEKKYQQLIDCEQGILY